MERPEPITLPDLPRCPTHPDGKVPEGFASCLVCWNRFYFGFENQKHIDRINRLVKEYYDLFERIGPVSSAG